jgi:hypothetical protein
VTTNPKRRFSSMVTLTSNQSVATLLTLIIFLIFLCRYRSQMAGASTLGSESPRSSISCIRASTGPPHLTSSPRVSCHYREQIFMALLFRSLWPFGVRYYGHLLLLGPHHTWNRWDDHRPYVERKIHANQLNDVLYSHV